MTPASDEDDRLVEIAQWIETAALKAEPASIFKTMFEGRTSCRRISVNEEGLHNGQGWIEFSYWTPLSVIERICGSATKLETFVSFLGTIPTNSSFSVAIKIDGKGNLGKCLILRKREYIDKDRLPPIDENLATFFRALREGEELNP